jgi:hypothetical protein
MQKKTRIKENAKKRAKNEKLQQAIVAMMTPIVPRWET